MTCTNLRYVQNIYHDLQDIDCLGHHPSICFALLEALVPMGCVCDLNWLRYSTSYLDTSIYNSIRICIEVNLSEID